MLSSSLLLYPLVLIALIAAVIWLAVRRRRQLRERSRQRMIAAAQYGWYPVPPNPWLVQVTENLFQRGRPGDAFAGDYRGRGVCILDYTYTTSNGKTQQQHAVHVVALNLPAALPPLTLTRDSGLKRAFGGRDLELESEAFNDAFRVACADDRYASAVLHPRMMEWMLFNPGLEWQFAGNALISWGVGHFVVPELLPRLEAMAGVIDRVPPFVVRDYGQTVR